MCLIRVRIDLQWIFKIEKRIEFNKTIRLSTHIDIFDEKKIQNFFWEWGVKKSKKKLFNDVKLLEKFICDIQFVEKCSIRGVLTEFCRKPHNASFKHPHDHI